MATVAYADIFEYPLTTSEIRYWFIKKKAVFFPISNIEHIDEYFFLRGKKSLVLQRKKRQEASIKKWTIAKNIGKWLRYVPSVQLVGVTGGLAMNNADSCDDIDLFFITKKDTVWTTRLFCTLIVDFLGIRRKPGNTSVANKVCLNMFMSEDTLRIPKKEQDLFSAHEVLQMVPLWERNDMYAIFLKNNNWVKSFLPNAWQQKKPVKKTFFTIHYSLFTIVEPLMKIMQLWYMKHHRTTEVISDSVLRFHPRDARVWVKEALGKRLKSLNVPLDKIFYRG